MTFTDSLNRNWEIGLTLGDCRTIRTATKIELGDASKVGDLANLVNAPEKLGEVLWLLSKEQAEAMGVTQDEFNRGLDGDALQAGWKAIVEAFIAFCPSSVRDTVRNAFLQVENTMELASKAIEKSLKDPSFTEELNSRITGIVASGFRGLLDHMATA